MSEPREPFASAYAAFLRARAELSMSDVAPVTDEACDGLFAVERDAVRRLISAEVDCVGDMGAKLFLLRQFADEERIVGVYGDDRVRELARRVAADFHDWQELEARRTVERARRGKN